MSVDKDTALRIYCALLARDPLAQQRFQELGNRFALLATLACEAALQFEAMYGAFDAKREAQLRAGAVWDALLAHPAPKDARSEALVQSLKSEEHKLPRSQLDLVDQIGSRA